MRVLVVRAMTGMELFFLQVVAILSQAVWQKHRKRIHGIFTERLCGNIEFARAAVGATFNLAVAKASVVILESYSASMVKSVACC